MEHVSLAAMNLSPRLQHARGTGKRPVLLLGWIPRIVTTIARSLRPQGVAVDVAAFSSTHNHFSRFIRHFLVVPRPDTETKEFVCTLRDFIRTHGHDMLIPTDDRLLAVLERHYDDFADIVHIACPPPEVLKLVLNKSLTLEVARRCGVPVPKTVVVSESGGLAGVLNGFTFPVVVKPAEKCIGEEEFKAHVLSSVRDAETFFPAGYESHTPLIVQEFCEGVGVGIEVLLHKGECVCAFQHRRLKELPYGGGFAATAIAEPLDPGLLQSAITLLKALGWEGVAMVEFRVNLESGREVLMEVNGRYWGSLGLPVRAGIDFPFYQWQLVHGEHPVIPQKYALGTKWRWTVGHVARLHSLVAAAMRSEEARTELKATLQNIGRDFSPSVQDSLFTFSDPIPAAIELLRAAHYFLVYDARAVARRILPGRASARKHREQVPADSAL
jgi:predicted ATP-grasp superfamily ATP-dependent carboligase